MKIIAFYLPQFHEIPENDKWWGKGFTEWTNVKKAKPLYEGHQQPKVPLNNNYYNLLNDDVKIWQANLAKKYGIYGFCYYHYWFNGKMLLEKPMEQMIINKSIDIPFCISWCNEPWTNGWTGNNNKVLISQYYGDETEWEKHYLYLRTFFKDDRYIFMDGKPLIVIYRPSVIPKIEKMIEYWNKLAKEDGFNGLTVVGMIKDKSDNIKFCNSFDYLIDNMFVRYTNECFLFSDTLKVLKNKINLVYEHFLGHSLTNSVFYIFLLNLFYNNKNKRKKTLPMLYPKYEDILEKVLSLKPISERSIPEFFVNWDNTPRYKERGQVIQNVCPEIFKKYFKRSIIKTKTEYHKDYMFFFAWNEWAEGGYLEPDEKYQYGFLDAIKDCLEELNEFPN